MNDGGGGDERWVSGGDETLFVEGSRSQYSAPPRRRRGAGGGREELGWANRSGREHREAAPRMVDAIHRVGRCEHLH